MKNKNSISKGMRGYRSWKKKIETVVYSMPMRQGHLLVPRKLKKEKRFMV